MGRGISQVFDLW